MSVDGDELQVAAAGGYLMVNFPSQRVFDKLTAGPPRKPSAPPAPKDPPGSDPLQQLNALVRQLGLVLDLRVAGKTHVTFGVGNGPKITVHAVFGKIGGFLRKL